MYDDADTAFERESNALVAGLSPAFDMARRGFVGAIDGGDLVAAERWARVAFAVYNAVAAFHERITIAEDGSRDQ
jgi:hypothetical protein